MIESAEPRRAVIGVVDDDSRILDSLEELLASAGYDVILFSSAVSFLKANGFERVDCLISDVSMPSMTGWDLLQIARSDYPDVPVLLITAQNQELSRTSAAHSGARYIFKKPFDGSELLATLAAVLPPKSS